jgi:hypothetical protein
MGGKRRSESIIQNLPRTKAWLRFLAGEFYQSFKD